MSNLESRGLPLFLTCTPWEYRIFCTNWKIRFASIAFHLYLCLFHVYFPGSFFLFFSRFNFPLWFGLRFTFIFRWFCTTTEERDFGFIYFRIFVFYNFVSLAIAGGDIFLGFYFATAIRGTFLRNIRTTNKRTVFNTFSQFIFLFVFFKILVVDESRWGRV